MRRETGRDTISQVPSEMPFDAEDRLTNSPRSAFPVSPGHATRTLRARQRLAEAQLAGYVIFEAAELFRAKPTPLVCWPLRAPFSARSLFSFLVADGAGPLCDGDNAK